MDRRASRSLACYHASKRSSPPRPAPPDWTIITAVAFSRGFSPRPYHANQELLTH